MLSKINGISILGVSSAVPSKKFEKKTIDNENFASKESAQKFIDVVGIESLRIGDKCASDYCYYAAHNLLQELNIGSSQIAGLVFISQTPDWITPATACSIQDRLRLNKDTICFDINLGCSGYTYGLFVVASMLKTLPIGSKMILVVGDTPSRSVNQKDPNTSVLFSDAGSATILEHTGDESDKWLFEHGTDGSGKDAIIVPAGYRNGFDAERSLRLEGPSVFSFATKNVPAQYKSLMNGIEHSWEPEEWHKGIDVHLFHQANKILNETIIKLMKIHKDSVPFSLKEYGNTSSASIPMTMCLERPERYSSHQTIYMGGFGIGLSWSSLVTIQKGFKVLPIAEIE